MPGIIRLVGTHTEKFKEVASKDGEMPMQIGSVDKKPCPKCQKYMKQGTILISVRDGESGDNPYRTGNWAVIKKEATKKIFNKETKIAFVEDTLWKKLGLPTG